jgi:hypothetical protein
VHPNWSREDLEAEVTLLQEENVRLRLALESLEREARLARWTWGDIRRVRAIIFTVLHQNKRPSYHGPMAAKKTDNEQH